MGVTTGFVTLTSPKGRVIRTAPDFSIASLLDAAKALYGTGKIIDSSGVPVTYSTPELAGGVYAYIPWPEEELRRREAAAAEQRKLMNKYLKYIQAEIERAPERRRQEEAMMVAQDQQRNSHAVPTTLLQTQQHEKSD